ncbi:MAG TPA: DUF4386 domain-containing protein [Flavipsychrobacter sp.]
MTTTTEMAGSTAKTNAKVAGLLYLVIIICGLFSEMFVRGSLIVPGDGDTTVQQILAAKGLYRAGFASDMIMAICDVGVGVLFYILLRPVNRVLALGAAFLRLAQATIIGLNLLNYYNVLNILESAAHASAFPPEQIQAQVMLYLQMHSHGYLISGMFFGFSCMLLGYLFCKSPYFPNVLGVMMTVASVGYLVDCFTNFLAPEYAGMSELLVVSTAVITEFALCLWLLIKGVRNQQ